MKHLYYNCIMNFLNLIKKPQPKTCEWPCHVEHERPEVGREYPNVIPSATYGLHGIHVRQAHEFWRQQKNKIQRELDKY